MAKHCWQAKDKRVFDTEREADDHDASIEVSGLLTNILIASGKIGNSEITRGEFLLQRLADELVMTDAGMELVGLLKSLQAV